MSYNRLKSDERPRASRAGSSKRSTAPTASMVETGRRALPPCFKAQVGTKRESVVSREISLHELPCEERAGCKAAGIDAGDVWYLPCADWLSEYSGRR